MGIFRISFWKFGPTELRILLAVGSLRLMHSDVTLAGSTCRLFDIGGSWPSSVGPSHLSSPPSPIPEAPQQAIARTSREAVGHTPVSAAQADEGPRTPDPGSRIPDPGTIQ